MLLYFLCAAVGVVVGGLTVGNDLRACGLLFVVVSVAIIVVAVGVVGYGGRLTVAFISAAATFWARFRGGADT